jgi:hypothetical protein
MFVIGNMVRAVENSTGQGDTITVGEVYEVVDYNVVGPSVKVKGCNAKGAYWFLESRFKLSKSPFKVGDKVIRTSGGSFGNIKQGDIRSITGFKYNDSLVLEGDSVYSYDPVFFELYEEVKKMQFKVGDKAIVVSEAFDRFTPGTVVEIVGYTPSDNYYVKGKFASGLPATSAVMYPEELRPFDFQPGDKVICVNPSHPRLEDGKIYTISEVETRFVGVKELNDGRAGWYKSQFKLVESIPQSNSSTQQKIETLFTNFSAFLKEKNKRYGDSALAPVKVFSKGEAGDQLANRADDKISRIMNATELKKNDVADLFGYLALMMIEKGWTSFDELLD